MQIKHPIELLKQSALAELPWRCAAMQRIRSAGPVLRHRRSEVEMPAPLGALFQRLEWVHRCDAASTFFASVAPSLRCENRKASTERHVSRCREDGFLPGCK